MCIIHLLVHSPDACRSQGLARPKPGIRKSIQVCHRGGVREPRPYPTLGHSQAISRGWHQKHRIIEPWVGIPVMSWLHLLSTILGLTFTFKLHILKKFVSELCVFCKPSRRLTWVFRANDSLLKSHLYVFFWLPTPFEIIFVTLLRSGFS